MVFNGDKTVRFFLIVLLIADLVFSFLQYCHTPLYGDMEAGVIPDSFVQKVLDDPLGFHALQTGEKHVNPNRFFAHFFFMHYFRNVPFWLQSAVSPIQSVYLSAALAKIIIQIVFVFAVSFFISGKRNPLNKDFLISAVIISPLFQAYGFWSRMAIIDKSIAYTFFYALPLLLLLLFMIPLLRSVWRRSQISWMLFFVLLPMTIILPLSGPLIPGVTLIISFLIFISYVSSSRFSNLFRAGNIVRHIPLRTFILLLMITIWSLYSLFLGMYDLNYDSESISLAARYARLPQGILSYIFHSPGVPIMLFMILLNTWLIYRKVDSENKRQWISALKCIAFFSVLYILLLPLGGYRPYRLLIIRYDTIMPVTIALISFFAASSFFLFKRLNGSIRNKYVALMTGCLMIYTGADIKGLKSNECERNGLEKIAASRESIVAVPRECKVLSWELFNDYHESDKKADLLHFWGITDQKKWFYNEP